MACLSARRARVLFFACTLTLAAVLPARAAPPATPLPSPSPMALSAMLSSATNPPRDLLTLAARLKLHTALPIDPIVNTTPTDYAVGRMDQFYVWTGSGSHLVAARLVSKTAHAYFYVQSGISVDLNALARSASTFENTIYPTDTAAFGPVWTPGIDNDQHTTIFNGSLQGSGAAGYVSAEDLDPRSAAPQSNQRKILYIDLGSNDPGSQTYDQTLAHEFQHVIHAHLHPTDEAWLNEGSSVLAQVLNGYSSAGADEQKAQQPDAQLDVWDPTSTIGYGNGFMWMLYLYEHFGGTKATRMELADSGLSGMHLFDDLLPKLGYQETANQMFADWVVANFLNDPAIDGGRYGYQHTRVHMLATSTQPLPFAQTTTMHQYAANYVDIAQTAGRPFTLTFAGRPTVPLLSTTPPATGFWWSNRGDSVDDTLTLPPLDLRHVARASLQYQLWYDLEKDYDYGYVEVSADGGATWYAQRTARTTNSNPNGANLGNGYTGSSCSPVTRARQCWLTEQLDLSAYVGKRILVRFEQVTDDELNLQGIALSGIRVPEIGFDGDSTAGGWQPAGWVRVTNTLAERWIVQAIVYGPHGVSVLQMPVGADGRGSLRIPAGSSRVVVAVSPLAPLTTVANTYTLGASTGN